MSDNQAYYHWHGSRERKIFPRSSCYTTPTNLTLRLHFIILIAVLVGKINSSSAAVDETHVVNAGSTATIQFSAQPWRHVGQEVPYFTIRFQSENRPFCIDGVIDREGLIEETQEHRFRVEPFSGRGSFSVNLTIDGVKIEDQASYVFTFILYDYEDTFDYSHIKKIEVKVPPGKAKCFLTISEYARSWFEAHCHATSGNVNATLSCFQDHDRVPYKGDISKIGDSLRGVFWLKFNERIHCCSHEEKVAVTHESCTDYIWPQPENEQVTTETTRSLYITSDMKEESILLTSSCARKWNSIALIVGISLAVTFKSTRYALACMFL